MREKNPHSIPHFHLLSNVRGSRFYIHSLLMFQFTFEWKIAARLKVKLLSSRLSFRSNTSALSLSPSLFINCAVDRKEIKAHLKATACSFIFRG